MDNPVSQPTSVIVAPQRKRRPRRYVLITAACIALLGAGIYGRHWFVTGRFIESTDNAYLRADQVSMAPRVSGQVAEIYVSDNQDVKAGQPLVKIDPRRYQMAERQDEAMLSARNADLAKSQADLHQQDLMIVEAQADLENAEANADLAHKEFDRTSPLAARGIQTQQQVDEKRSLLDQAQSTVRLKKAVLDAARQQVTSLKAEVEQAEAQLSAAKESVDQAQIDLDETVLRSPIDGRVGDRTVQLGQFAQPGTLLLTIVPVDSIYLVANFKETQIARMRAGQIATVSVDAYPDLTITGTVDSFAPGTGSQFALLPPENATGNFTKIVQRVPVRIRLDLGSQNSNVLVPGLSIDVAVDTRSASNQKVVSAQ